VEAAVASIETESNLKDAKSFRQLPRPGFVLSGRDTALAEDAPPVLEALAADDRQEGPDSGTRTGQSQQASGEPRDLAAAVDAQITVRAHG